MKKTYMSPKMDVTMIKLEKMISSSPLGSSVYEESASSARDVLGKRRYADEDFDDDFSESIW